MSNETQDIIECPQCGHLHPYDDLIEVGDMSGEFDMDCDKCGELFKVDFYCIFHFTTKK
jgi:uncharacterized C2H2 Zn-finger protein